jgi:hypothetical protein
MPEELKENDKFPNPIIRRLQKRITENTMQIFLMRTFYGNCTEADLVLENIQSFISKRN